MRTRDLTLTDLVYAATEYIRDNGKEETDYLENKSEFHIYRICRELESRIEYLENTLHSELKTTDWETLICEKSKKKT